MNDGRAMVFVIFLLFYLDRFLKAFYSALSFLLLLSVAILTPSGLVQSKGVCNVQPATASSRHLV